ncbi:hypothetical protein [Streptomyces sp. WMMB 322]|uniref:hypothetical protein n=1 Tax=Streptomyces sp. WMMB 322 TaxID=1286821 RepID=UPI0006E16ED1|nr:hypothetical protein [Streptomyces sp. WMMB 322]SCK56885.1 hypothetical protein H180DRAFT_05313 [Streptomyces sp. WMMB 322]
MRTEKRVRTSEEAAVAVREETAAEGAYEEETFDIVRVTCPDCGRPIALLAQEDRLPEHALCASPWNPFGLTVCQGSGRAAAEAAVGDGEAVQEHGLTALLTLPEGLDWRRQPFSHAGGRRTLSLMGDA